MISRTFRNHLLPVALAVCASLSQAQTGSTTRIEETDPSVTFSGDWYENGSSANSGGGAALTNTMGARAAISFTGTGITWLGVADPWAGVARVYLDGTLNTVNTYGPSTQYQRAVFTARGLAPGPHTLSIEVIHMRDVNGSGSWIWVDGFEIENGAGVTGGVTAATGRIEQNNPALIYTGTWFLNTNPVRSGGTAVLAVDAGSRVTVSFNGASIMWIAHRDEWSGIARVYLDGVLKATVDTYLTPAQAQSVGYSVGGLGAGAHTLTIELTGAHNPNSGGSWIWVDAFEVVGGAPSPSP
jgi:hypothetical protein